MSLLILVTGILVWFVFEHQARRHRMELKWEYKRLNLPMPEPAPKLTVLQAWLNILLGVILAALGAVDLLIILRHPVVMAHRSLTTSTFFIGGGTALLVLGIMALRERRRWNRRTQRS